MDGIKDDVYIYIDDVKQAIEPKLHTDVGMSVVNAAVFCMHAHIHTSKKAHAHKVENTGPRLKKDTVC